MLGPYRVIEDDRDAAVLTKTTLERSGKCFVIPSIARSWSGFGQGTYGEALELVRGAPRLTCPRWDQ